MKDKPRNFELVQVHELHDSAEVVIRDKNSFYALSGKLILIKNPKSVYPPDYFDDMTDLNNDSSVMNTFGRDNYGK